jgi:2-iminobutanoate/2-iminopropanoate deaminase
MTRQAFTASAGPKPVGPYSHAIGVDGLVFLSGFVGIDPATGALVDGGIEAQADQALVNIGGVLDAAGCSWADVVKCTVFLADIADFGALNGVYARYMPDPPPARSTFAVAALPLGALVEIEVIARRA